MNSTKDEIYRIFKDIACDAIQEHHIEKLLALFAERERLARVDENRKVINTTLMATSDSVDRIRMWAELRIAELSALQPSNKEDKKTP